MDMLFGHNFEITRSTCLGGVCGEMVKNKRLRRDIDGSIFGFREHTSDNIFTLSQSSELLYFKSGVKYTLKIYARPFRKCEIRARIKSLYFKIYHETSFELERGEDNVLLSEDFIVFPSTRDCVFELSCLCGGAEIKYISLMEADNYFGMRRDVLDLLKQMMPGCLRYPGGCFAEYFDWKDGLLPIYLRKDITVSELDFLLPNNYSTDNHDIGINEFIMACRYADAKPQITVRLSDNDAQDAADFVEYCNGSSDTMWGLKRAQMGFTEPFDIEVWYIGNELRSFGRNGMNTDAVLTAGKTREFIDAMKKVCPDITVVASTWFNSDRTECKWTDVFMSYCECYDIVSVHNYLADYYSEVKKRPDIEQAVNAPWDYMLPHLQNISQSCGGKALCLDEWNYNWGRCGSAFTGIYTAGVMHILIKNKEKLYISHACYFNPFNESAIRITPYSAALGPDGVVFKYLSAHIGNSLCEDIYSNSDVDILTSIGKNGTVSSIINRSTDTHADIDITIGSRAVLISPARSDIGADDFEVTEYGYVPEKIPPMSLLMVYS